MTGENLRYTTFNQHPYDSADFVQHSVSQCFVSQSFPIVHKNQLCFYCKDIFKTQQRKGKCFNCRLQGLIIIFKTFKAQFSKALNSQASSLKVGAELAQDPLHILVQVILIQMSTVPIVLPQPCFFSLSFPEATGAARLRRRGGR